jgi:hypothetical protein
VRAELFDLELFGEGIEHRYRKMRPEVEAMPWGTLDLATIPPDIALAARATWTGAAFQEHRTAVACAATLRALIEARAPLDLIALASRFPLDELVHVELCARMAMAFGGGTEIRHDADCLAEGRSGMEPAVDLAIFSRCGRGRCSGQSKRGVRLSPPNGSRYPSYRLGARR